MTGRAGSGWTNNTPTREDVLAELREMEPYARLSAVGLTVVECHRDGETWTEIKDKRDAPGGRR